MTTDVPNAFVQTNIVTKQRGERIIMKIQGPLVKMLTEIDPDSYAPFVVNEGKGEVLYVVMLKALYGMLQSFLLCYKKFRQDIEDIGFEINPYDPCVTNQMIDGNQHTLTWHVDDVKSSHVDSRVNNEFYHWLQAMYVSDGIVQVKVPRGPKHDYLAIILDYREPGKLRLDMTPYVKAMIDDFLEKLTGVAKCPWNENLFKVHESAQKLNIERAKIFHTFVMRGMFLCKRGRQDIQPGISFLTTRVKHPNKSDWRKSIRGLLPRDTDVDSSLLIHQSSRGNMPSFSVDTYLGGMIGIATQPMGPTVAELDPITHDVSIRRAWLCHSSNCCYRSSSCKGTMISSNPHC
jgi:hypothetical protein